jgi:hypothetical protein
MGECCAPRAVSNGQGFRNILPSAGLILYAAWNPDSDEDGRLKVVKCNSSPLNSSLFAAHTHVINCEGCMKAISYKTNFHAEMNYIAAVKSTKKKSRNMV